MNDKDKIPWGFLIGFCLGILFGVWITHLKPSDKYPEDINAQEQGAIENSWP